MNNQPTNASPLCRNTYCMYLPRAPTRNVCSMQTLTAEARCTLWRRTRATWAGHVPGLPLVPRRPCSVDWSLWPKRPQRVWWAGCRGTGRCPFRTGSTPSGRTCDCLVKLLLFRRARVLSWFFGAAVLFSGIYQRQVFGYNVAPSRSIHP